MKSGYEKLYYSAVSRFLFIKGHITEMSKNDLNHEHYYNAIYMKDGKRIVPAPEVLTESEAIQFLRLDQDGFQNPQTTLQYFQEQGLLRACLIEKRLRYTPIELLLIQPTTSRPYVLLMAPSSIP